MRVLGVVYKRDSPYDEADATGDFARMVHAGLGLVVFNDNFQDRNSPHPGAGNACMRPFRLRGLACGVPTGWRPGVAFKTLGKLEKLVIDIAIDRILHCVARFSHAAIFYSIDDTRSELLGVQTFQVSHDVRAYITKRLLDMRGVDPPLPRYDEARLADLENVVLKHLLGHDTGHSARAQMPIPSGRSSVERPPSSTLIPWCAPKSFVCASRASSDRGLLSHANKRTEHRVATVRDGLVSAINKPCSRDSKAKTVPKISKRIPPNQRNDIDWRIMQMAPALVQMMPGHIRLARQRFDSAIIPKSREQLVTYYGADSIPSIGPLPCRSLCGVLEVFDAEDFDIAGDLLPDTDCSSSSAWRHKLVSWERRSKSSKPAE